MNNDGIFYPYTQILNEDPAACTVVRWQLRNFLMCQVKFDRFSYSNEHTKEFFDSEPSKKYQVFGSKIKKSFAYFYLLLMKI